MAIWDHLPSVFANIVPLADMPLRATFSMMFSGKSLDEVASEEASRVLGGNDTQSNMGDDFSLYSMDDENAVDKATYQASNPNAIMTPWGPTLSDEALGMVFDEYPGIQSMIGLNPEQQLEAIKDADDLIDNSGGWLDDFMGDVQDNAMAMGADVISTAKGMFDETMGMLGETMKQTLPTQAITDSLDPRSGDFGQITASPSLQSDLFNEGDPEEDISWWEKTLLNLAQADPITKQVIDAQDWANNPENPDSPAYVQEQLNELLDTALEAGESDEEIIQDIIISVSDEDYTLEQVQLWTEEHDFENERPDLFNALTWVISSKVGTPEYTFDKPMQFVDMVRAGAFLNANPYEQVTGNLVDTGDGVPEPVIEPVIEWPGLNVRGSTGYLGPDTVPPGGLSEIDLEAGVIKNLGEAEATSVQFVNKFYTAMSKVPGGNHSAVRESMDKLFRNAYTLFAVWNGPSGADNMTPDAFEEFLDREGANGAREGYVWNPRAYTQDAKLNENFDFIKEVLARGMGANVDFVSGSGEAAVFEVFGDGDNYNNYTTQVNRDRLAGLYATGWDAGYISSRIHRTMESTTDYLRKMGNSEMDIFNRATLSPYEERDPDRPENLKPGDPNWKQWRPDMNRDLITTDSGRYYDTNQALWEPLEGFELRRDTPPAPPVYDPAALGAEGGTRGEAGWVPFPRNMPRPPDAVDDILDDIGTGTRGEAGWVPFSAVTPILTPSLDPAALGANGGTRGEAEMKSTLIPPPPALVNPYQVNVPVGNAPPPPLNEEEAGKLHNGLEYKTGYWTGGSWDKWDSLSPELKKITMSSDWWMEGGTFNPEQPASSFIWGDGGRQSSAFPTGSAD